MLGVGSCWLLDSLVEDLLVLAILVEPSLLDWSERERESRTLKQMAELFITSVELMWYRMTTVMQ